MESVGGRSRWACSTTTPCGIDFGHLPVGIRHMQLPTSHLSSPFPCSLLFAVRRRGRRKRIVLRPLPTPPLRNCLWSLPVGRRCQQLPISHILCPFPVVLLIGDGVGRGRRRVVSRVCSTTTPCGIAFGLCQWASDTISFPHLTSCVDSLVRCCLRVVGGSFVSCRSARSFNRSLSSRATSWEIVSAQSQSAHDASGPLAFISLAYSPFRCCLRLVGSWAESFSGVVQRGSAADRRAIAQHRAAQHMGKSFLLLGRQLLMPAAPQRFQMR